MLEICIRVSPADKKKLQRNAKKSGLNMSSYLRKCGLKQRIYKAIDDFKKENGGYKPKVEESFDSVQYWIMSAAFLRTPDSFDQVYAPNPDNSTFF